MPVNVKVEFVDGNLPYFLDALGKCLARPRLAP